MIDEIHKKLIGKYTAIIGFILVSVFCVCSYLNLQIILNALDNALLDYLGEEVQEAHENFTSGKPLKEDVSTDISSSLTLLSFWFKADKLVYAELPDNEILRRQMLLIVNNSEQIPDKVYSKTINDKWHFRLVSRNITENGEKIGRVVVVYHATKLHENFNRFMIIFSCIIIILIFISYFISKFLAGKAVKQIKKMFERQKKFVSDASHELRTPLSVIMAYTELLEQKSPSPEILQNLKEEITLMSDLTGKLLQFARFDNDCIKIEKQVFNLSHLGRDICRNLAQASQNKNIKIKFSAAEDININADQTLIKQMLYILLDNALKYSPQGSEVRCEISKTADNIYIKIKDKGIGIAQEDQEQIFERFFRSDKARSRNNEGLGLGLSMALMIAEQHQGSIEVESKLGKGSTFTVILPC